MSVNNYVCIKGQVNIKKKKLTILLKSPKVTKIINNIDHRQPMEQPLFSVSDISVS